MVSLKKIAENWKCIGIMVATAAALCTTAVTADNRYAKQQDLKQMQLSQNYNNFQMRLDSLKLACQNNQCNKETLDTIRWLEQQIKMIEKQMGFGS